MNSLFIVLPILTILMFDLGLTLEGKDFRLVMLRYKAVLSRHDRPTVPAAPHRLGRGRLPCR